MELRQTLQHALKEQYQAGLAMLADCVEKCPDDVWLQGEPPRFFWRIAWHSVYYTHFYLVQNDDTFNHSVVDWPVIVKNTLGIRDTQKATEIRLPDDVTPLSRQAILDHIAYVRGLVDTTVDALDLGRPETGFAWYPNMTKLSHELLNLRHIQGHVGQLSELLMARGIDTEWVSKGTVTTRADDMDES